jgi:pimeloyl-ACP methyl ester carboxylesterase
MRRKDLIVAAAVTGFVCAAVAALFKLDMWRAKRRLANRSKLMPTTFGAVEYATAGSGEPVLALHGAGGGFDQGLEMTAPLAKHGYRIIAPSRFGYLRSSLPRRASPATQADAYAQLLDRLAVRKAVVVGISAGSWSALQFAIRHPARCRALVLIVPAPPLPKSAKLFGPMLTRLMFGSDFGAWVLVRTMSLVPGFLSQQLLGTPASVLDGASADEKDRIRQIVLHLMPAAARSPGMQLDIRAAAGAEHYPLDKISCPLLAISASDDSFGTAARAKEIAAAVRHGTSVVFASGGHGLVDRQAEGTDAILSFLARAEANG